MQNSICSDSLRVELVTDSEHFARLRPAWNALLDRSAMDSVFLRHEWFTAAFEWRKHDSELAIICIYDADDLIGILPLVLRRARRFHIAYKRAEFLTVPDTQYCELITAEPNITQVNKAIYSFLCKNKNSWDLLVLDRLAPDSIICKCYPELAREYKLRIKTQNAGCNYGINLSTSWKDYYATRTRRLKKGNNNIANKIKRAELSEKIVWLQAHNLGTSDTRQLLDMLVQLSAKSWKNRTGLTLDQPGPNAFITKLTSIAQKNNWLSVFVLYFGDQAVAAEYQLAYRGVVSALRADFDDNELAYSPGSYLNWRLLEKLFSTEYQFYSLGPGSNEYKLRWSDSIAEQFTLQLYSPTLKGRFLAFVDLTVFPILRRLVKIFKGKRAFVPD